MRNANTMRAMEIQWEEPPPAVLRAQGKSGKYLAFSELLRENKNRWALLPQEEGEEPRAEKGSKGTAQNIRRGAVKGFTKGEFEAVADGGKVYVRFVGMTDEEKAEAGITDEDDDDDDDPDPEESRRAAEQADLIPRVRSWAKVKGIPVAERGRMSPKLILDYCRETGTPLPNGMKAV